MENTGARLKKIRLEKGLTLEEMQKKTKIHLNILKAIEEDSIVNISPIYIKGFLKIYCNSLGVNPGDYTFNYKESVKQQLPEVKPASVTANKENNPVPRLNINTQAVLSSLIKFIQPKIKYILLISILFLLSIGLFKLGRFTVSRIKSLPKRERVERAHVKKSPFTPAVSAASKHEKKVSPKVQTSRLHEAAGVKLSRAEEPAHSIRLGIRAKEDCWIQVKSDGKIIFQNNLKKGRFESWQAKEKIELSLGNAAAAELEVNGKFIPALGRRGQSMKNILITKDGLSTSR